MPSFITKAVLMAGAASAAAISTPVGNPEAVPTADKQTIMRLMAADPAYDFHPSTTSWCTWWFDNEDGSIACETIPIFWGITEEQWHRWNPSIGEDCSNFPVERSYCVEASNEPEPEPEPEPSETDGGNPTPTDPPDNGIETPEPVQPGMVGNCDAFHFVEKGDNCGSIASDNGITDDEFFEWNPRVGGSSCTGLWLDAWVCVSVIGHEPTPTDPGEDNGIETPSPIQDDMTGNCDEFHFIEKGQGCGEILELYGLELDLFTEWNPAAGDQCTGLWAETWACVSVIGHEPSPTDPGDEEPDNGIETPSPIQDGMTGDCDKFHFIEKGQGCGEILKEHSISIDQFADWNPAAGDDCSGIWAETWACVSIIGHEPSPTDPGNGIETPSPIQDGMVDNCDDFHFVDGDTCGDITQEYGISLAQFTRWNPAAGDDCTGLWGNTWACVSIIGHEPSPTDPGNGIETPSPIQNGMTDNCDRFHYVEKGEICEDFLGRYGISLRQFSNWNPAAGRDCTGLWAETWACVGVL